MITVIIPSSDGIVLAMLVDLLSCRKVKDGEICSGVCVLLSVLPIANFKSLPADMKKICSIVSFDERQRDIGNYHGYVMTNLLFTMFCQFFPCFCVCKSEVDRMTNGYSRKLGYP